MIKNIVAGLALSLLLGSCGISRKISHTASKGILSDSAFVNAHTGISIYEPATGKYWYRHQADKFFVPASNTKIVSCFAAIKYLGDSIPGIRYKVLNDSTVAIQGTGDPTFLHPDYTRQPVYDFLKKFNYVLVNRPQFTRYLGNGWSWGDYMQEYMAQRSAFPVYGNIVTVNWIDENRLGISPRTFEPYARLSEKMPNGFSADKNWDNNHFEFTAGRTKKMEIPFRPDDHTLIELLQDTLHNSVRMIDAQPAYSSILYSRHVDEYLGPMMHRSDNFFAEQTLLLVSGKMTGELNEKKAIDTLLSGLYRDLPERPKWADGSGLSRYNVFTPDDFVFILNKMQKETDMNRIKKILPTGGEGTISSYYINDKDRIFVKTGTLNGVVALSGYLYTKKDKFLVFSVLVNNHNDSATNIRKGIEKFIQHLIDKF